MLHGSVGGTVDGGALGSSTTSKWAAVSDEQPNNEKKKKDGVVLEGASELFQRDANGVVLSEMLGQGLHGQGFETPAHPALCQTFKICTMTGNPGVTSHTAPTENTFSFDDFFAVNGPTTVDAQQEDEGGGATWRGQHIVDVLACA